MPSNENERDFTQSGATKRPGRISLELFQNEMCSDGFPGLQLAVRNWVKYYLHDAQMEQNLDLNSKKAINLSAPSNANDASRKTDVDSVQSNLTTHLANITQHTTRNHNDLQNIGANDHHNRSHAITGSSDHTAGSNKIFYCDNSSVITELALGASNTYLKSQGATSAPVFSTVIASEFAVYETWDSDTLVNCTVTEEYDSTAKQIVLHCEATAATASGVIWSQFLIPQTLSFPNSSDDCTIIAKQTAGADNDVSITVDVYDPSGNDIDDEGINAQVISNSSFTGYDCAVSYSATSGDRIIVKISFTIPDVDDKCKICIPKLRVL
jgi:hypothetical protein